MSGWVKCVLVTLVALVTAGLVSVSPSSAAEESPSSAAPAADTFATVTAAHAYTALRAQMAHERRRSGKVHPIAYLPRMRALPARLSAPMLATSLTARPGSRVDADGEVTFFTGSLDTAACLDLSTGTVAAGECGHLFEAAPDTLTTAYDNLVRTLAWFDQHEDVYGQQARDAGLVAAVLDTEVSARFTATFADADADGLTDGGVVVLSEDFGCGTVTLPEHDPAGLHYTSSIVHGTC